MGKRRRYPSKTSKPESSQAAVDVVYPRTLLDAFKGDTNALHKALMALKPGQGLRVNQWGKVVPFSPPPHLWKLSYRRRKEQCNG